MSPLMLKYLDKAIEGCNALLCKISIPAGPRSVFGVSSRVYFC